MKSQYSPSIQVLAARAILSVAQGALRWSARSTQLSPDTSAGHSRFHHRLFHSIDRPLDDQNVQCASRYNQARMFINLQDNLESRQLMITTAHSRLHLVSTIISQQIVVVKRPKC
jgi:hypothetical protein